MAPPSTSETPERNHPVANPASSSAGLDQARLALVSPGDVRPAAPQALPTHLDLSHQNLYHRPGHVRGHGHSRHAGTAGQGHETGSPIKPDGSEQKHHVGKGETLSEIASKQLGPNASKHDVEAQINAIVKANPGMIASRDKIIAGTDIALPKFNLHGTGESTEQTVGPRRQTTGERVQPPTGERVQPPTGERVQPPTGERVPPPTGERVQPPTGERVPPPTGDKVQPPTGDKVQPPTGDKVQPPTGDKVQETQAQPKPADLATEKQKLLADLDNPDKNKGMSPEQVQQVKADMAKLEGRAQADGKMDQDVAQTYQQMTRLLDADPSKAKVSDPKLLGRLVEQIAHQAADPNIDQGNHNTCNVTTLGDVTFTKHPGVAAEAIATTALTGQWRNPADGKVSVIPEGSLKPGTEEDRDLPKDGQRSYATQLLNLALVNDQTQRRNPPEYYSQEQPERGNQNRSDTGERLRYADGSEVSRNEKVVVVDANGMPRAEIQKRPARSPNLDCSEIEQIGERLGDGKQILITNPDVAGVNSSEAQPRNAQELAKTLGDKQSNGSLPAVVMVDANNPEFGGSGKSPNGGRWHVLSVTGYDSTTGQVTLSNQWGKNTHNMKVSVARLAQMMKKSPDGDA
jgi:hypothetical protein